MRDLPVSLWGLVVAVVGFVLTRFTVTLAATEMTTQFLFAGIVPLVLGLSLSAFGVILAVGSYDRDATRTVAVWTLLGTVAMFVLVVLTLLGSDPGALMDVSEAREQTYLSNFLTGGAIGGTLTGLYAAENRRQRTALRQQANRLVLLNRLLRDRVINAATAIKGHGDLLEREYNEQSVAVVGRQSQNVIDIVEDVRYLSETAEASAQSLGPVDLSQAVETELDSLREEHPGATIEFTDCDEHVQVRANTQLREVLAHLFENAVKYSDTDPPQVAVTVEASPRSGTVRVTDSGPGLPTDQQALLERGEIAEFDDPTTGFGLNVVRLLVEGFDGDIDTQVDDSGTTVAVTLPRTASNASVAGTPTSNGSLMGPSNGSLTSTPSNASARRATPGVLPSRIALAVVTALVAGATMGGVMAALDGDIAVIGALYGIEDATIALITHEFHSIVFGLFYASFLSALPTRYVRRGTTRLGVAIGFGLTLWLVAAGLVMPVWLLLVGVEAPIPNLTAASLAGHITWGGTIGLLYHLGDQWLVRAE